MARAKKKTRRAAINKKVNSAYEPVITAKSTDGDMCHAYNWYNEYYESDDAKEFLITYLKAQKKDKQTIKKLSQVKSIDLRFVGWNARILSNGHKLPKTVEEMTWKKLDAILARTTIVEDKEEAPATTAVVISIQERVDNRASELIAGLEEKLDEFYTSGKTFDPSEWFRNNAVKPQIAKRIAEYYQPLYAEVFDAIKASRDKDSDLLFAYRRWAKGPLKKYLELVKSIIAASETATIVAKATRKPRKKKEKPVTEIVKKVKYQEEDADLKIKSIKPTEIVGANQLWLFNTKYRTLTVYNAMGPAGLGIKGTTITGYDEKTSTGKKLRKPADVLPGVLSGGKIALRRVLTDIRAKEKVANGRINNQTILLRVVK